MIETPWYIEEIQNSLLDSDTADPDFLSEAAAHYAEACQATNERLRQIAPLLQRGRRSEVIQFAEIEPNLLEWFQVLDFPELENWCALLKLWGRTAPPPLLLDICSQINESHAIESQLKPLLKKHRLLPLAGASISVRIQVLRELVKNDPENPAWPDELDLLEKERTKELRRDLAEAYKSQDLSRLIGLVDELLSPNWLTPPSKRVINMAQEFKQRLLDNNTVQKLETIAGELEQAHSELDVEKGRQIRARYNALQTQLRVDPQSTLNSGLQEAFDWLFRQDALEEETGIEKTVTQASELTKGDPEQALQICQQAATLLQQAVNISTESREDFVTRINNINQAATARLEDQHQFEAACKRLATAISQNSPPEKLQITYKNIVSFEGFEFPSDLRSSYERCLTAQAKKKRGDFRYRLLIIVSIVGLVLVAGVSILFML